MNGSDGFKSHPGQSFPLSLCGPISICRANAHMVYGLKHQHFTLHSITYYHSFVVSFDVQNGSFFNLSSLNTTVSRKVISALMFQP